LNNYEVMYIIRPDLDEEATNAVVERFSSLITANGGKVEDTDTWGKRKLAYPIEDYTEGYYVLCHFTADSQLPKELERNFRISDSILRYLVTRPEA